MAARTDPRKVSYLAVLLVVLAVVVAYRLKPALVENVVGGSAAPPGTVGDYDVPSLGWSASEEPAKIEGGGARSLFTYGPPPTPTPDLRPTPTPPPTLPPRPYVPPTPAGIEVEGGKRLPPPPAFSMTFLGWLGPDRQPIGVFRDGGEIVVFARGDTVKNRFILREVGPSSVTVGYVGYPANVTKKVPLSQ